MKRVNLLDYFGLAEALAEAKQAASLAETSTMNLYLGIYSLPSKLRAFVADDNGFSTCKHVATDLVGAVDRWVGQYLRSADNPLVFDSAKYEVVLNSWQYAAISGLIQAFKSVFEAECRDVDVYSVGEVSIYKTSALVSRGAEIIPPEIRAGVSDAVLSEFNNAGRCLAFSLPTACGFHALRGLELVMDRYLQSFGVKTDKFKSWNDYIQAAQKLVTSTEKTRKPAAKVATMLDRMRELDRNPLMHPRNVLDDVSADMLYKLAAITVVEMVRDMGSDISPISAAFIDAGQKVLT